MEPVALMEGEIQMRAKNLKINLTNHNKYANMESTATIREFAREST